MTLSNIISAFDEYIFSISDELFSSSKNYDGFLQNDVSYEYLLDRLVQLNLTFQILFWLKDYTNSKSQEINFNDNLLWIQIFQNAVKGSIQLSELLKLLENSNSKFLEYQNKIKEVYLNKNYINNDIEENEIVTYNIAFEHMKCNINVLLKLLFVNLNQEEINKENYLDAINIIKSESEQFPKRKINILKILDELLANFNDTISLDFFKFASALRLCMSINRFKLNKFIQLLENIAQYKDNDLNVFNILISQIDDPSFFDIDDIVITRTVKPLFCLSNRLKKVGGQYELIKYDKNSFIDFSTIHKSELRKYFICGINKVLNGDIVFRFGTGSFSNKLIDKDNEDHSCHDISSLHNPTLINRQIQSIVDALVLGLIAKGEKKENIVETIQKFFREKFKAEFVLNFINAWSILSSLINNNIDIFNLSFNLFDMIGYQNDNILFGLVYFPPVVSFSKISTEKFQNYRFKNDNGNENGNEILSQLKSKERYVSYLNTNCFIRFPNDDNKDSVIIEEFYKYRNHDHFRRDKLLPSGQEFSDIIFSYRTDEESSIEGFFTFFLNCINKEEVKNLVGLNGILYEISNRPSKKMIDELWNCNYINILQKSPIKHWLNRNATHGMYIPIEDILFYFPFEDLAHFIIPAIGFQDMELSNKEYVTLHSFPSSPGNALGFSINEQLFNIDPLKTDINADYEAHSYLKYNKTKPLNNQPTVARNISFYPIEEINENNQIGSQLQNDFILKFEGIAYTSYDRDYYHILFGQKWLGGSSYPESRNKIIFGKRNNKELRTYKDYKFLLAAFKGFTSLKEKKHNFLDFYADINKQEIQFSPIDENEFNEIKHISSKTSNSKIEITLLIQVNSSNDFEIKRIDNILKMIQKSNINNSIRNIIITTIDNEDANVIKQNLNCYRNHFYQESDFVIHTNSYNSVSSQRNTIPIKILTNTKAPVLNLDIENYNTKEYINDIYYDSQGPFVTEKEIDITIENIINGHWLIEHLKLINDDNNDIIIANIKKFLKSYFLDFSNGNEKSISLLNVANFIRQFIKDFTVIDEENNNRFSSHYNISMNNLILFEDLFCYNKARLLYNIKNILKYLISIQEIKKVFPDIHLFRIAINFIIKINCDKNDISIESLLNNPNNKIIQNSIDISVDSNTIKIKYPLSFLDDYDNFLELINNLIVLINTDLINNGIIVQNENTIKWKICGLVAYSYYVKKYTFYPNSFLSVIDKADSIKNQYVTLNTIFNYMFKILFGSKMKNVQNEKRIIDVVKESDYPLFILPFLLNEEAIELIGMIGRSVKIRKDQESKGIKGYGLISYLQDYSYPIGKDNSILVLSPKTEFYELEKIMQYVSDKKLYSAFIRKVNKKESLHGKYLVSSLIENGVKDSIPVYVPYEYFEKEESSDFTLIDEEKAKQNFKYVLIGELYNDLTINFLPYFHTTLHNYLFDENKQSPFDTFIYVANNDLKDSIKYQYPYYANTIQNFLSKSIICEEEKSIPVTLIEDEKIQFNINDIELRKLIDGKNPNILKFESYNSLLAIIFSLGYKLKEKSSHFLSNVNQYVFENNKGLIQLKPFFIEITNKSTININDSNFFFMFNDIKIAEDIHLTTDLILTISKVSIYGDQDRILHDFIQKRYKAYLSYLELNNGIKIGRNYHYIQYIVIDVNSVNKYEVDIILKEKSHSDINFVSFDLELENITNAILSSNSNSTDFHFNTFEIKAQQKLQIPVLENSIFLISNLFSINNIIPYVQTFRHKNKVELPHDINILMDFISTQIQLVDIEKQNIYYMKLINIFKDVQKNDYVKYLLASIKNLATIDSLCKMLYWKEDDCLSSEQNEYFLVLFQIYKILWENCEVNSPTETVIVNNYQKIINQEIFLENSTIKVYPTIKLNKFPIDIDRYSLFKKFFIKKNVKTSIKNTNSQLFSNYLPNLHLKKTLRLFNEFREAKKPPSYSHEDYHWTVFFVNSTLRLEHLLTHIFLKELGFDTDYEIYISNSIFSFNNLHSHEYKNKKDIFKNYLNDNSMEKDFYFFLFSETKSSMINERLRLWLDKKNFNQLFLYKKFHKALGFDLNDVFSFFTFNYNGLIVDWRNIKCLWKGYGNFSERYLLTNPLLDFKEEYDYYC